MEVKLNRDSFPLSILSLGGQQYKRQNCQDFYGRNSDLNEEIFQKSELFYRLEKRAKTTITTSDSIHKKEICDSVGLKFPRQPSEIDT
jgi:hypothetical protein